MAFGISFGGLSAQNKFLAITGATKSRASEGDAVLEGHLVEVKQANSNTLNQVRAVKYLPIVVLYVPEDAWFVILTCPHGVGQTFMDVQPVLRFQ